MPENSIPDNAFVCKPSFYCILILFETISMISKNINPRHDQASMSHRKSIRKDISGTIIYEWK